MADAQTMRLSQSIFKFKRASQKAGKQQREERKSNSSEAAKGFNEVIRALRKEKHEELARRDRIIEELKEQNAANRKVSLADKEQIEKLFNELNSTNDIIKDQDALLQQLKDKEAEIEDLKQRNAAKEKAELDKIHRLGHEIEDKNIKLHEWNEKMDVVANEKQVELDAMVKKCTDVSSKADEQQMEIVRLKNEIAEKERALKQQLALEKSRQSTFEDETVENNELMRKLVGRDEEIIRLRALIVKQNGKVNFKDQKPRFRT